MITILLLIGAFCMGGVVGAAGSFYLAREYIEKYRKRFTESVETIRQLENDKQPFPKILPEPAKQTHNRATGPDYHSLNAEQRLVIIRERYKNKQEIEDDFKNWDRGGYFPNVGMGSVRCLAEGEKLKLKQEREWENGSK